VSEGLTLQNKLDVLCLEGPETSVPFYLVVAPPLSICMVRVVRSALALLASLPVLIFLLKNIEAE